MFFGPTFAVIISIGQLVQARKSFIDYLFAISFLGMAVWMYQICIISTGILDIYPYTYYLVILPVPVVYMVPPVMVLRYKWVLASEFRLRKSYLFFLIPAIISLGIISWGLIPGISGSEPLPHPYPGLPVKSAAFSALPFYYQAVYITAILPSLYVALLMTPVLVQMLPVWLSPGSNKTAKAARMGYISAFSIVFSNFICFAGFIYSFTLVKVSVMLATIATIYVYLVTQRHNDYYRLLRSETRKANYEKSRLSGLDVNRILIRLNELMKEEKYFTDEELSLRDLAKELAISPHQLSEILNEKLKKNFNTFVNEYRVEEAEAMLKDEPDRSVLSVGIAAGFNSNTTFCTVFSRVTGMSPSQYRKKVLTSGKR
jgi:AraC-like DNA-binding protein